MPSRGLEAKALHVGLCNVNPENPKPKTLHQAIHQTLNLTLVSNRSREAGKSAISTNHERGGPITMCTACSQSSRPFINKKTIALKQDCKCYPTFSLTVTVRDFEI